MAQLTKAAIMDAFVHLLEQMPMDQITVQAITAGCGISRNTFYYHYSDIFALLKAVLQRDMDMLLVQRRPGEHAREGLRRLIDYIADRQRMVQHIYSSIGHATMEDYLVETTWDLFMAYLRDTAEGLSPSEEDMEFLCYSYQFMLIGILLACFSTAPAGCWRKTAAFLFPEFLFLERKRNRKRTLCSLTGQGGL